MKWISIFGFLNFFPISTFSFLIPITEPLFESNPTCNSSEADLTSSVPSLHGQTCDPWSIKVPSYWPLGLFSNEHVTQRGLLRVFCKIKSMDLEPSKSLFLCAYELYDPCEPRAEDSRISCKTERTCLNQQRGKESRNGEGVRAWECSTSIWNQLCLKPRSL